jgi:hypothetical protein
LTARAGLFVTGASNVGVTTPQSGRLAIAGLLSAFGAGPLDAAGGIIQGPGSPLNVTGSTSGSNMKYNVAAGYVATARNAAADGLQVWANDATVLVDSGAPAPGSGSRWDLIYVVGRDANLSDASSVPLIGVLVGVAGGSPTKPYSAGSGAGGTSLPAGALVLAEASVGTSIANASLATITMVAPYKVAKGAEIPVRSAAERDALTAFTGLSVKRLDFGGVVQRYNGTSWATARDWHATARAGSSDNFSANTRTQLQSLTFTAVPGTYQVVSRMCISSSVGSGAWPGFLWVTAGGTDIVDTARADTNSLQRSVFTTIESFTTTAGGSITVAHAYQMAGAIGTVWNGTSTDLSVYLLGT